MTTLFQTLEKEYCPPLDSSLLAALCAEVETDNDGKTRSPSAPQVTALRLNLRELAAHADEAQLSELTNSDFTSHTEDTISSQDFGLSGTTVHTSLSSSSSGSACHTFDSPLDFLRAALPDVPTSRLKKALKEVEKSGKELDMWDLVGSIFSEESIRELEERGLDALEDSEDSFREEDVEWEVVSPKSKYKRYSQPPTKRKASRATKVTIIDIRQQNHGTSQHRKSASSKPFLPDLWTQVQSIATNIATYLPPHPPSFFLSYLHSPKYKTPYEALYASLESLCTRDTFSDSQVDYTMLFNLLDILFPEYEPLDSEQRSRLVEETKLCIRATDGRGDDVVDLVKLLRELNLDASSGRWELGIYHLPPLKPPPSPIITTSLTRKRDSLNPVSPLTPRTANNLSPLFSSTDSSKRKDLDSDEWQAVPLRKHSDHGSPRLAHSIPAYAGNGMKNYKTKGSGNGYGKGGKGDVGELSDSQSKIREHRRGQEEYLRKAAKEWQRGDKKNRGGEVAFYYAEKARELQEKARLEALNNARDMVLSKRWSSGKSNEIDLHGTTVYEAVTIAKEALEEYKDSPGQTLKIITGKGTHSTNKVAVLKPAIKEALVEDGWIVGTWDAGLMVRGRNS